ncbi:cytoplasmic phosphatidylinositol transfer protein 1-like [Asterias rubens]|uniref:cytoplasmic phosphatidylinositol transfer protein 1-like n=1 Tax=Asterias rubens TaxID=7604 RepID=UPI001455387E|nr:cytoplasmic phosphatidylinositol transfer protein 1-like [Asterias rubens]
MLIKEYRICMPLSVEEYKTGQLYMIAKHSNEQSHKGEGVEVIKNEDCHDPVHGKGRLTEKRIYLSSRLPTWVQKSLSKICNYFYVTEKAWNYFPHTITEYTCSFLPRFSIFIETRYENNSGTTENCLSLSEEELKERQVLHLDIAYDDIPEKYFKEEEDLTKFRSKKTGRGPLQPGWREQSKTIMCSYKLVRVKFEVWGFQTRVENMVHKAIQDILLLGHRQAFAWIDEWFDMSVEDVRNYEKQQQEETNSKVNAGLKRQLSQESANEDEFTLASEEPLEDLASSK